jgi:hypothetical protein
VEAAAVVVAEDTTAAVAAVDATAGDLLRHGEKRDAVTRRMLRYRVFLYLRVTPSPRQRVATLIDLPVEVQVAEVGSRDQQ